MAAASTRADSNGELADAAAFLSSYMACLKLCPKFVRIFLNKECHDKDSTHTYRDYCEELQDSVFSNTEWKKLSGHLCMKFEKETSLDEMDMTALFALFYVVFNTKRKVVPVPLDKKLKAVKNFRNGVMHDFNKARNPAAVGQLNEVLIAFIQEAGSFYSLSANEVQDLQNELDADIQKGFSLEGNTLLYATACMAKEGRTTLEQFVESTFETQNLMFSMGRVKRTEIFHELKVMLREGKDGEAFPYWKIFEHTEKFIIVSGVAGAGKSTLLENIALQYVKPQSGTSVHLQDFQLLVYIQCRDHTTQTLNDVLIQQFPDVHAKLGKDLTLQALLKLGVLFLIDGYDEYGRNMTVLEEVTRKTRRSNCRVIITTRPHGVAQLRHMLQDENENCVDFEIAPLTELEQQLNFLSKYEPHLPGFRPHRDVQKHFETLNAPLRNLFTEPHRLLQFCSVCVLCPEKIRTWLRETDVAKDTHLIYRDLVTKKLTDASYPDLDIVVDNFFLVICEAALDFLRANTLTFTEGQFKELREKCRKMLKEEHDVKDLDTKKVLSCVFNMKRPPARVGEPTYSFNHKSDQEYFASKCVVRKIEKDCEKNNVSLRKFLWGENPPAENRQEWSGFREVLQYVVQDLSADRPELIKQRWHQLKEALQKAGANFSTWRDVVLCCSGDVSGVKKVAEVAKIAAEDDWEISDGRDVVAAARMLPHAQPSRLEVRSSPHQLRGASWGVAPPREGAHQPWEEMVRLRKGGLWLWLNVVTPCDDLLTPLQETRAELVKFWGGIAESASVAALSSAVTPASSLDVHLLAPLSLSALQGRCGWLRVYVRPLAAADVGPWPLPAQPRPGLRVTRVQPGAWRDVVHTVQSFAPHGNRYGVLVLVPCHLREGDLDRTVAALQRRGIRTEESDGGPTRWERSDALSGPDVWLDITDELPERLAQLDLDFLPAASCSPPVVPSAPDGRACRLL